jgi:predicted TIM-barrel fold metal-dependent hydrolase
MLPLGPVMLKKILFILCSLILFCLLLDVIPFGAPSEALTTWQPAPLVDSHLHVAGIGAGNSGCFVGKELAESYKFGIYLKAFGVSKEELEAQGDELIVWRVSNAISESQFVKKAVVLAMDGILDASGNVDTERTQVYVPNEFVARTVKKTENLLFGASVNPYRADALERLVEVKKQGAVLVKWIPAIMGIDPADEKIIPFYKKLVELKLPLLSHAGQERSFAHADDTLGDPLKLELPLSLGVTVIAAHIATTGTNDGVDNFKRLQPLFDKYPNLYTDISSLTQLNKLGYLKEALEKPMLVSRMINGSDWPLQFFPLVSPWYHANHARFADLQYVAKTKNVFDRDVLLKKVLGVPDEVFERTQMLLQLK